MLCPDLSLMLLGAKKVRWGTRCLDSFGVAACRAELEMLLAWRAVSREIRRRHRVQTLLLAEFQLPEKTVSECARGSISQCSRDGNCRSFPGKIRRVHLQGSLSNQKISWH